MYSPLAHVASDRFSLTIQTKAKPEYNAQTACALQTQTCRRLKCSGVAMNVGEENYSCS